MKYRPAKKSDIPALVSLENASFEYDRLTEKNFKYFIDLSHGDILVQEDAGRITGYGVLLFHKGTALARLYSLAVDKNCRGKGLGRKLLAKLEQLAKERGSTYLRLEVKASKVDEVIEGLIQRMSGAAELEVPLLVEAGVGDNWDEAH